MWVAKLTRDHLKEDHSGKKGSIMGISHGKRTQRGKTSAAEQDCGSPKFRNKLMWNSKR